MTDQEPKPTEADYIAAEELYNGPLVSTYGQLKLDVLAAWRAAARAEGERAGAVALVAENRVLHERAERFRDMAKMERNAMNNIMKFFEYRHLPENLQAVSRPIGELAAEMNARIPDSAEKTAGLRKLLEAKDCFVRASL